MSVNLTDNKAICDYSTCKINDRWQVGEPASCLDDAGGAVHDKAKADRVENGRGEGPGDPLWYCIHIYINMIKCETGGADLRMLDLASCCDTHV